ncbi:glycosyltransferase [Paramagnetospirillum magneticum]|uniref:Glycosyltransferase n=1 Tax=Paramagnetospirillum magneticum (strain ATCC 700264 / AMB-1) TaxID=342108 RepID=Q2W8E0_PARM1|nr:glycosyltransferase [Paramagnetospirillum magneticum]BAE49885.1 Glycosyltransferase [Paramagnetospirillum magneticum AMB-1]
MREAIKPRGLRIAIDTRSLVVGVSGGIIQNQVGVFRELFKRYPEHTYFVFCTPFNREIFRELSDHIHLVSLPPSSYLHDLAQTLQTRKIDVLFRSYPTADAAVFPMERQIIYIPDNQHDYYPQFFSRDARAYRKLAFDKTLREAGAVGTISEFSRSTLQAHPECACSDIFLMAPALQEEHSLARAEDLTAEELAQVPDGDFFIYPANLWEHKNHRRVLEAFSRLLAETNHKISFIFTGNPADWPSISRGFEALPICHLGYVRAELVQYLLQKARALVFFSLFEGFGIPLLEAFHAGTPVLCSNCTSLPEVAGDATLLADPLDISSMAAAMRQILESPALTAELVERGRRRLDAFTWAQSADNLMAAFVRVAGRTVRSPLDLQPLVSVVTPSYNQGRFIRRTIESVLNQTYGNIEYQVIDGGSDDETVDILKSYGGRFHWVSEPDGGQTAAINKGLAQAKGEILCYLNSDDVLEPDALEKVVDFFLKNPECDLVYGKAHYIDENDAVIGSYKTSDRPSDLHTDCIICQPAAFWRAGLSKLIGQFDETISTAMDYDYWLRAVNAHAVISHLPEYIASSRLYAETKTMAQRELIFHECFDLCARHVGYVHAHYFFGYWHWKLIERRPWMAPFFRFFPLAWKLPARISHAYFLLRRGLLPRAFKGKLRLMAQHPSVRGGILRVLLRLRERLRHRRLPRGPHNGLTVFGAWSDCWLAPEVEICGNWRSGKKAIRLGGFVPTDCTMRLSLNHAMVIERRLEGNREHMVEFSLDFAEGSNIVTLSFDAWISDTLRDLSFCIYETNLFCETDILVPAK